jgi:hypothetical protein
MAPKMMLVLYGAAMSRGLQAGHGHQRQLNRGDDKGEGDLQHYFDSRGVARVYEMSLGDGTWNLERHTEGFSPLDLPQRYAGTFSEDGARIEGAWEDLP